jgi:ribonuclease HII
MGKPTNWERETYYITQGQKSVVGMDEVGRGSWAGPLVAVAFSFLNQLPAGLIIYDSKQLTANRRERMAEKLMRLGSYGIGRVSAVEIDRLGLQPAQFLAYQRAIINLRRDIDIILLDGRTWPACPYPVEAIVRGDSRVASIGAASIIAKVYRDKIMQQNIHPLYPQYGFNTHVGYGTRSHKAALDSFGPCPEHRQSFRPVRKSLQ